MHQDNGRQCGFQIQSYYREIQIAVWPPQGAVQGILSEADQLRTQAGAVRLCGMVGPWGRVQHVAGVVVVVVKVVDPFQGSRNQAESYRPWLIL